MVLGTSKYLKGGGVNCYFQYRMEAAYLLFKNNKIKYIIVSGDNRKQNYNEPRMMKLELIRKGIPYDYIYEDYYGINTLYSISRVYKIFHQNRFTIISQKFHNERAIFIGNCIGYNVIGFNARNIDFNVKICFREILARIKVFFDMFIFLRMNKLKI